ncbi:hypothetical protein AB0K00_52580 [Dactylosporangium sp. NPDC049525]|uniref:hypothetical protein n=1 Tax=Dactylosporangium sp. NPDC049525 TaxID=3154730 RepID=UPI0034343B60
MDVDRWVQRRVSGTPFSITALKVALVVLFVDLAWEVTRANVDAHLKSEWPWRATVLDPSTCATLAALIAGLLVTRRQYGQVHMPVISWATRPKGSDDLTDPVRTIRIYNAGGGRAIVKSIAYRLELADEQPGQHPAPHSWMDWHSFIGAIESAGLNRPRDIFVFHLAPGAVIPLTAKSSEGIELLAFSRQAARRLRSVDVRIQATDTIGDVYEKQMQCLRGYPDPGGDGYDPPAAIGSASPGADPPATANATGPASA